MMSKPRQVPLPPSGTRSPHSMRMVVVLPLPLAPRKPQISPLRDLQAQPVDHRCGAEALAQIVHVDDEAVIARIISSAAPLPLAAIGRTATGWPGLISVACSRGGRASHHEDELGAARLAVDHRRRVFGLRRDEGDRSPTGRPDSCRNAARPRSPRWTSASLGSGTKKRTKMFPAAAATPPGRRPAGSRRGAPARRRRRRRPALRHGAGRAAIAPSRAPRLARFDEGLLCLDLALAPDRGAQLRQRRLEACDLGDWPSAGRRAAARRAASMAPPVFSRSSLRLRSDCDLVASRLGVGEIGLGLLDFGRLAAGLEIGELRFRLVELARSPGRARRGRWCRPGRTAARRPRPSSRAPTCEGREQALLGRADLDEIGVGIALPFDRRRRAVRPPPAGADSRPGERHDEDEVRPPTA